MDVTKVSSAHEVWGFQNDTANMLLKASRPRLVSVLMTDVHNIIQLKQFLKTDL